MKGGYQEAKRRKSEQLYNKAKKLLKMHRYFLSYGSPKYEKPRESL